MDTKHHHHLRYFLLKNMPFVTDQANEEMIKPFKKKSSQQTMHNIGTLTWKVVVTSRLMKRSNTQSHLLFRRYDNPFGHSKRMKVTPPTAHCSLSSNGAKSKHSYFFPTWTQKEWNLMSSKLLKGIGN